MFSFSNRVLAATVVGAALALSAGAFAAEEYPAPMHTQKLVPQQLPVTSTTGQEQPGSFPNGGWVFRPTDANAWNALGRAGNETPFSGGNPGIMFRN